MPKMPKMGFRGERKRILTPTHTLLFGDFSQGERECGDGKGEEKLEN